MTGSIALHGLLGLAVPAHRFMVHGECGYREFVNANRACRYRDMLRELGYSAWIHCYA